MDGFERDLTSERTKEEILVTKNRSKWGVKRLDTSREFMDFNPII